MTVDYKVVNVGETHCVEERSTGYIIKSFDDVSDAKKMMKFLNLLLVLDLFKIISLKKLEDKRFYKND